MYSPGVSTYERYILRLDEPPKRVSQAFFQGKEDILVGERNPSSAESARLNEAPLGPPHIHPSPLCGGDWRDTHTSCPCADCCMLCMVSLASAVALGGTKTDLYCLCGV